MPNRPLPLSPPAAAAAKEVVKAKDLLLIRKFVRRMKGSKCKKVIVKTVEKAEILWPLQRVMEDKDLE